MARSLHLASRVGLIVLLGGVLHACAGESREPQSDLYVTKTEDTFDGACQPSDCSLREAVAAANAAPGPNTIHLEAGTYRLTLTGAEEDAAATGDLDLTETVSIIGTGFEGDAGTFLTGDADLGDRLIHAVGGEANLEALYLGGGAADSGGAIRVDRAASLRLRRSRLDASQATGTAGGGLIYSEGALTIEASTLTNGCSAGPGGAVRSAGSATLNEVQFEGNEAAGSGGAVANGGSMTASGLTISRSFAGSGVLCQPEATADGGGIFNEGDLTLSDSQILRTEASRSGGGIYSLGTLTVERATIRAVAGDAGGAVAIGAGRATLTEVDLEAATGSGDGGGLFVEAGATATVIDSLVAGTAGRDGGAIANEGELTVRGSEITLSRGKDGGGIHSSGMLLLESSAVRLNSAREHGGGVFILGTATIDGSTIAGNSAEFGGGLFLQGNAAVSNCTVSGNNASSSGGGVVFWGSGDLNLTHCTLTRNAAPSGSGLLADTYGAVSNTILGGNTQGPGCQIRRAPIAVGNLDQDGSCGFNESDNLLAVDPLLGPLQDNGGSTETHLLLAGSPARNAANPAACLPLDQRGIVRPQGGLCDIGSVELEGGT